MTAGAILVTGGCGFIGSNFIRQRLALHPQERIANLDALTYAGNPRNLDDLAGHPGYRFIHGNIGDSRLVAKVLREHGITGVINFAAETHVDRSIEGPDPFVQTNVAGTYVLLEQARQQGVHRFLHISTDEVYGSVAEGFSRESDRLDPTSPYSASKASADLVALSFYKTFGLPVLITRSSNNYGPYQYPEKFIPRAITCLLAGQPIPLYAQGQHMRDWIHVEDNCRAIAAVWAKGRPGEIYNIGSGQLKRNREVAEMLARLMGSRPDVIQSVPDRPAHDLRYALDCARVRQLGFQPRWIFEKGLEATVQWYRAHENWWKPLMKGVSEFASRRVSAPAGAGRDRGAFKN